MAAASDVPARYDLVLSGGSLSAPVGFVFLDALEPSLPFRTHRAIYGYSPTFIERQNVSGSFGDNQQDFFLTSTQRDWSLGEQQRYAHVNDPDSARRYWQGTYIDRSTAGKVAAGGQGSNITFAAAVRACAPLGDPFAALLGFASSTNLYSLSFNGTISDKGAHGLGAAPNRYGMTTDGLYVYLTTEAAGTVGVRRFDVGAGTFSTFSASWASALAFVNNTLYGYRNTTGTGDLVRYDTAGTATSVYTWKAANGAVNSVGSRLREFGGKLLILRLAALQSGATLWIYDGTAPSQVAQFGSNFYPNEMAVVAGTVFIGGVYALPGAVRPAIQYWSNGTVGELWRSDGTLAPSGGIDSTAGQVALVPFGNGLVFNDDSRGTLMYYDFQTGGASTIDSYTVSGDTPLVASCETFLAHSRNQTAVRLWPGTPTATAATLTSSLFDFDSSLTKFFRGVTVDFDSATDGNGGTVDIAYRVGDVDGSYTNLQTGATSGTEYILTGISGHSVSVKVTLNKGTSTSGPVLKRVSVRAAPILTSYRTGEYVLDCTGDAGKSPRTLRDGTPNPLAGFESLAQLQIAKASTTPLTVTDRTGTYTGIVEQLEAYEEHPGLDDPTRSGEFVVKLIMRGI